MTKPAIHVTNLGKRYRIGARPRHAWTLREYLRQLAAAPFAYLRESLRPPSQERTLWALRDVSFEIQPGEVVGIVGPNGAGKSTLLKVLSRITEPTEGRAEIRGRVSSLLEVGTGFHPELSGRDNVYLNGAILGMTRREISRKFDEIVAFADLERFMDTAVKRYSSGMYVRLAFAVAAHLEPEVLLVDEVLAVGDAAFQKKCIGKIGDVVRGGRTVLFVSHQMAAIRELCSKSLSLDGGRLRNFGPTPDVIRDYLHNSDLALAPAELVIEENPDKEFQVLSFRLRDTAGTQRQGFACDEPVVCDLVCGLHRRMPRLYGCFAVRTKDGTTVMFSDSYDTAGNPLDELSPGRHRLTITIPARSLGPGEYDVLVRFRVLSPRGDFDVDNPGKVATFTLVDHASRRGNRRIGYFSTLLSWETRQLAEDGASTLSRDPVEVG